MSTVVKIQPKRKPRKYQWRKKVLTTIDPMPAGKTVIQKQPLSLQDPAIVAKNVRAKRPRGYRRSIRRQRAKPFSKSLAAVMSTERFTRNPTELSTLGVLDPFAAYAMELRPPCPFTVESRGLFRWKTRMVVPIVTVPVGEAHLAWFRVSPTMIGHVQVATAFDTLPEGITPDQSTLNSLDDPSLTVMNGNGDFFRMTHCGMRVRNTTPVATMGGQATYGLVGLNNAIASLTQLQTLTSQYTHASVPGDIETISWRGMVDASDYSFIPFSTSPTNPQTVIFYSGDFTNETTLSVEIVSFWEAQIVPEAQSIFQPVNAYIDLALQESLLCEAYAKVPQYDVARNVRRDDGIWDTFKSDVSTVFGTLDSGLSFGKKVWGAVSSVGDAISGAWSSIFGAYRHLQSALLVAKKHKCYSFIQHLISESKTVDDALAAVNALYLERERSTKIEQLKADGTMSAILTILKTELSNEFGDEDPWSHLSSGVTPTQETRARSVPAKKT